MDATSIYAAVSSRYSASALAPSNHTYSNTVASAFGYSAEELASIPADSNLGLSCGNPIALANLKEGETVIDLGSGAGFDCFLAARKVGEKGRVIGVDMNEDMLTKARNNASKANITNTTFISANITTIPLTSSTADIIISNCVINLVPHAQKPLVFVEMHRLLKPGGRVAISDILANREFTEEVKSNLELYCGCVAGASTKGEYEAWLREAGFEQVVVVGTGADLNVYSQTEGSGSGLMENTGCCGPVVQKEEKVSCCGPSVKKDDGGVVQDLKAFKDVDLNELASSYKIFAVKSA